MTSSAVYSDKREAYSTFSGVYVPSLLTMFGVVLFLRMGWIVGVSGFFYSFIVITLTLGIALVTAMSMASIASNFSAHDGSAYDVISNELGSGLGSPIGILLYFAQTFTVCFCALGVAESLSPLVVWIPSQFISIVVLMIFASIAYLSIDILMKMQLGIFAILSIALATFFFGQTPSVEAVSMVKASREPFWKIFSVFFPVAMGVECGISMSKHLKTPAKSILNGSVAAVVTAFVVYVLVAKFLFYTVAVEVLQTEPLIIHKCSGVDWLIHLGVWLLATASAIGSLLSAPRTLQTISLDGVLWGSIGKDFRVAIGITLLIAFSSIYLSNLNVLAPALTMVLLAAYGLINLTAALEEIMDNPSWRPTFRVYWVLSLIGALLCFIAMFMIDPVTTFAMIGFSSLVWGVTNFFGVGKKKDDLSQSLLFFLSRSIIYKLAEGSVSQRSWRPNFLVFTRSPIRFTNLLLFARELTRRHGFLTVASVFPIEQTLKLKEKEWIRLIQDNLKAHKTKALVEVVAAKTAESGMKQIIETYGIGTLVPNTIILGQGLHGTYSDIIEFAVREQRNVLIFRDHPEGIPYIPKEIDIWWDESQKKNANLMLLLAFMLKRSPLFQRANFTLKSMVTTENSRHEREQYFKRLLEEGHIDIESKVFLGTDMMHYASKEGLSFIGMRGKVEGESNEEYEEYYKQQMAATKELAMVIFTLSFEHEEVRSRIY